MTACLMLHGVGRAPLRIPDGEQPYWISEDTLKIVLAAAKTYGADLTFDDGNDSDARIVLPKLVEAELTATFFIPSDRIGSPGYVTENDIRALHAAGMTIGSHGCAHLNWLNASDADIAADVTHSIERLSQIITAPVRSVAIPYGQCDRRVLGVLRRLGIGSVHSSFRGPHCDGAWLVRRDCIMDGMGTAEITEILTRKPDFTAAALTFLRIWRHTGNAAVWTT